MHLVGKTIAAVRPMLAEEQKVVFGEVSRNAALVLVLDDGTQIISSRDAEGNGPGEFFVFEESTGENYLLDTPEGSVFLADT